MNTALGSSQAGIANSLRCVTLAMLVAYPLAGCNGPDVTESTAAQAPASTTGTTSSTPQTSGTPSGTVTNRAPTIAGVPPSTATPGVAYAFTPTANDLDGDTLTFSVANKPAWAAFDPSSGKLSGLPSSSSVGSFAGITISVADGKGGTAALPTFSIAVASVANRPPTISGAPSTTATAESYFAFAPTASDPDGNSLSFSIQNKPAWASFNAATGLLSGTPATTDTGTYPNIMIAVTDGALSASLPAFTITVGAAQAGGTGPTYRGYTYALPATRPYISLGNYASVSRTSSAYSRLKAQVDDVVTVTNGMPQGATYDQLITALNSNHYGFSATDSVLMYRLSGDQKYILQAIRMVDLFVTSENARIAAGNAPVIAGDSYLDVGPLMEQLALTYDYGFDLLSANQKSAWSAYAEQTIYNVWNFNSAQWGGVSRPWSGWSVNDPGNNYFYSFMKATQLWALANKSSTWMTFLQTQKFPSIVTLFGALTGGGSREGTGYGTSLGSLFENYAYWRESTGEDLAAYSSHAKDTIDYWIHATVPTFEYFASIGDQARVSMPRMFDYQRKLVEEAVALNLTTAQAARGTWWLNRIRVTDGGNGSLTGMMRYGFNFRYDLLPMATSEAAPTDLAYDARGTGALFARSDWSTNASWMHTNAGYYDQAHAHQDQGAFSFFKGTWLTITNNAFSHSGINMGVDVQNVIRFVQAGAIVPQNESVNTKTVSDNGNVLQVNENLSAAYSRNSTKVSSWSRELTYQRSDHSLRVHDRCTVANGVTPIWQLQLPVQPVRQADGSYLAGSLRINASIPAAPTVAIVDMRNVSSDFNSGYRLEISNPTGACEFDIQLTAQ